VVGLRALAVIVATLSLVAVAGCGASDEEQVRQTIERFYRASAEGDGREACDQLSPGALAGTGLEDCQAAIDQLGELGGPETRRRLAEVAVRQVRVEGERASALVQVAGQTPVTLALRKVDGEWKLESLGSQFGAVPGRAGGA
jgi:hypothetical protein